MFRLGDTIQVDRSSESSNLQVYSQLYHLAISFDNHTQLSGSLANLQILSSVKYAFSFSLQSLEASHNRLISLKSIANTSPVGHHTKLLEAHISKAS